MSNHKNYLSYAADENLKKSVSQAEEYCFSKNADSLLLVGGEMAGIQDFIYDIIRKAAAKNLKGRSFYLQLVVESIVRGLLETLALEKNHIIYSSGGGFYLIAPNTDDVKEKITAFQKATIQMLFEQHGIALSFSLGYIELNKADIKNKLPEKWGELVSQVLQTQKRQRFLPILKDDYAKIFDPIEMGAENEQDIVTSEELKAGATTRREIEGKINKVTAMQIDLGKDLRDKAAYIVIAKKELPIFTRKYEVNEKDEGKQSNKGHHILYHYFYVLAPEEYEKYANEVKNAIVYEINSLNENGYWYGGNDLPRYLGLDTQDKQEEGIGEKDSPKYFDELAGHTNLKPRRLGILRMDVDNLGKIFQNQESGRSFAEYRALSLSLDYFFKYYLNKLWEANNRFKAFTQIIYSGGDDLFIIGKWDVLIDFAEKIQAEFKTYTTEFNKTAPNKATISGGVTFVTPKFPISKAAKLCEDDEKLAKSYPDKNAITLLGVPLGWERDYEPIKHLKAQMVKLLSPTKSDDSKDKVLPKAFLMQLIEYYEIRLREEEKEKDKPSDLSWKWRFSYVIARTEDRYKKSQSILDFLDQVKRDLFSNSIDNKQRHKDDIHDAWAIYSLAAKWAEMEYRQNESMITQNNNS